MPRVSLTLPFRFARKGGSALHDQVVYAVERAVVSGQLRKGDAFPSVRTLSRALVLNPNTAHRIVTTLVREGVLDVCRGRGTVVAYPHPRTGARHHAPLTLMVERLVVKALWLSMKEKDLVAAVRERWRHLGQVPTRFPR